METYTTYGSGTVATSLAVLFNPATWLLLASAGVLLLGKFSARIVPKWAVMSAWIGVAVSVAAGLFMLFIAAMFASEVNRETWTAEERATFEARVETYFVYDAQGREIMLTYLDGKPNSIGVHTGPNTSEQQLLEDGQFFEAFTESGGIWVRPSPPTDRPDTATGNPK